jgi:hypothetical protein
MKKTTHAALRLLAVAIPLVAFVALAISHLHREHSGSPASQETKSPANQPAIAARDHSNATPFPASQAAPGAPEVKPPTAQTDGRTPLVWEPVTTKSGKKLLGARLDHTWAVPLKAPPAK